MDSITKQTNIAKITTIIKNYCTNKKINFQNIKVVPTNEGLSNFIYHIFIDENSKPNFFFKFYNNKTDRKFEGKIIEINSKLKKNCSEILETDYETYRIENFLEKIRKLNREEIYTKNFEEKCIEKISEFNTDLVYDEKIYQKKNIFEILKNNFSESKEIFEKFQNNFYNFSSKKAKEKNLEIEDFIEKEKNNFNFKFENFNKIKNFLEEKKFEEILEEIFPADFLEKFSEENSNSENYLEKLFNFPLVLSHNDVHIYNFLVNTESENFENFEKFTKENLMLIDYEYACFNIIGFDYVNFQIENFYDLEFAEYPYFSLLVENTKIIYDEKYYEKYLHFFDIFLRKVSDEKKFENFFKFKEIFLSRDYYNRVCRLASIFWFYTALKFLDFDDIVYKKGFNILDYSIERLNVYENYFI